MSETLHHTIVTKLTGYSKRSISLMVRDGIIKCKRDCFGLPRFDMETVTQFIARAEKFKRRRAAAKKRRP